jgi:hypothetical protein
VIEFGDGHHAPIKPMRRALYDKSQVYRDYFIEDVQEFIADNKVNTKLPKVGK